MHLDRETYVDEERKALYSLDVSAEGFLELLVRSLESTLITAGPALFISGFPLGSTG